ncbi:hypothetical protein CPT_Metamorpho_214 [Klebsiella phage Metamorpho]|nr:hypothetical protein CPT_Metamorpho_214 [Klebsiella phage Metamorpho]
MNQQELKMFAAAEFDKMNGRALSKREKHVKVLSALHDLNPDAYDVAIAGKVARRVLDNMASCETNTVNFFVENIRRSRWLGAMSAQKQLNKFALGDTKIKGQRYSFAAGTFKTEEEYGHTASRIFCTEFNANLRRILNRSISLLKDTDRVKYPVSSNPKNPKGISSIRAEELDNVTVRIHINSHWTSGNYPHRALRAQVRNALKRMDVVKEVRCKMLLESSSTLEVHLDPFKIFPSAVGNIVIDEDVAHMYLNVVKPLPMTPVNHVEIAKNSITAEMESVKRFIDTKEGELYKHELFIADLVKSLNEYKERYGALEHARSLL